MAAALVILSPGLGCYEAVAGVVKAQVSVQTSVGTVPAGLGAVSVSGQSALSNNTLSLALSPASLSQLPSSHPGVAAPAVSVTPVLTGSARISAAIPALPQSAAVQAPAPLAAPLLAAPAAEKPQEAAGPLAALQAQQEKVSAALSDKSASSEGSVSAAATPFDGASRTAARDADIPAVEVPLADVPGAARKTSSALRRAMVNAAGGTAVGGVLIGVQHAFASGAISAPAWSKVLEVVGSAGYYIGNGLSFVFAIPQILKTFQDGHHGATPVKRALLGMAASLALGIISAPLAGQLFWGLQNIFGALTLVAPLAIGKAMTHFGWHLSSKGAVAATAAVSAALLAVSFGIYAAAAAVLPAFLPVLLGKAGISIMSLVIQVATGAAFLFLFAPDISAILKKKAPTGFTPFFSLLFSAASVGFIAWTLQKAVEAPANSSEQIRYIIYAAQNVLYAVVAGLSYVFGRKHEKAKAEKP